MMFSDLMGLQIGHPIEIDGEEAHHAVRVKRVRPGERIGLIDGRGGYAIGTMSSVQGSRSKPVLVMDLERVGQEGAVSPKFEVWAALPKGDRLDRMIEQLTQLGVTRYRPLICERSQRKEDTVRVDKLQRVVEESMKQCRRVWQMDIGDSIQFDDALVHPGGIVADASGRHWGPGDALPPDPALIVGPEGGWSNKERDQIVETNARVCRFGMFVMRIESAAVAGASVLMNSANPD